MPGNGNKAVGSSVATGGGTCPQLQSGQAMGIVEIRGENFVLRGLGSCQTNLTKHYGE